MRGRTSAHAPALLLLLLLGLESATAGIAVEIQGLAEPLRENALRYLGIWRQRDVPELPEAAVQRLHARAGDELRQALRPFGYYEPEIDAVLERRGKNWRAVYTVRLGEPVRFGTIDISLSGAGAEEAAFRALVAAFPLARGEILDHARYETAKRRFLELAEERGYLDARFTRAELRVDVEHHVADVVLAFDTGPRYRFGPVRFVQESYDPAFVTRFVEFREGEPFSVPRLLALQYALSDSDYFTAVDVRPQREAATEDLRVPVEIRLEPRPKHKYTFGLGFGTDTGPRAGLAWENRRVNRSGHRLAADFQVSAIAREAGMRYAIPLARPGSERFTLSLRNLREDKGPDAFSETDEFGLARSTLLGDWRQTLYLNFHRERNEGVPDVPPLSLLTLPGASWVRVQSDHPVYTREGFRLVIDLRGSHPDLLRSDAGFAQLRVQGKRVHALGERSRLILRGEFGTSYVDEFSELPLSQRFFTGGDQTVRGFDYNTLAPLDQTGQVAGGRHLVTASVEVDRLFFGNWGAAVFLDAGNAMDDFDTPLRRSAGAGLRWRSPVGMVRFDYAQPIDGRGGDFEIHLSIGPEL